MSKTKIVVVVTSAFINLDGEAELHTKTGFFSTEDAAKSWLSEEKEIGWSIDDKLKVPLAQVPA